MTAKSEFFKKTLRCKCWLTTMTTHDDTLTTDQERVVKRKLNL